MKCKGISPLSVFIYTAALVAIILAGLNSFNDFFNYTSKANPGLFAKRETQKLLETKTKPQISYTKVDFMVDVEQAKEVLLCADFTAWTRNPLELEQVQEGHFSKTLFLPKGEYKYYFLVDGQAQKDEGAPSVSLDLKDCPLPEISLKNVL